MQKIDLKKALKIGFVIFGKKRWGKEKDSTVNVAGFVISTHRISRVSATVESQGMTASSRNPTRRGTVDTVKGPNGETLSVRRKWRSRIQGRKEK